MSYSVLILFFEKFMPPMYLPNANTVTVANISESINLKVDANKSRPINTSITVISNRIIEFLLLILISSSLIAVLFLSSSFILDESITYLIPSLIIAATSLVSIRYTRCLFDFSRSCGSIGNNIGICGEFQNTPMEPLLKQAEVL